MNNEVTLETAQWYRDQAAKYIKLAVAIEDVLRSPYITSKKEDPKQHALFQGNEPLPSFDQIQKAAERGGRVLTIAMRLKTSPDHVRDMLTTPNSQFYIGGAGWIRRKGEPDPFKK